VPIQDGVLIACKSGVVELTATIADPEKDEPDKFAHDVNARIFDHQYQAMTDAAILNPSDIAIASCFISRDALPPALKDALTSLAFQPVDTEANPVEERSLFSRFQKRGRTKLEKWRSMYLRANEVSERLGRLEEILVDEMPRGRLPDVAEEGASLLANACRTVLRLLISPTHEHLGQLERLILQERGPAKGRLVLHPHAVKAIASFVSVALLKAAPSSHWSDDPDDDSPLYVAAPRGGIVRSDPEYRVVNFVAKGNKEMLTTYMETILRQSLTAARQT
jgi:hypothetical protein